MTPQLTISEEQIERDYEPVDCPYTATENGPALSRAEWLPEVRRQLAAITALPNGWDSHGAPSPDPKKLAAARGLLECLCENADLPKPHVNPTPSGGVQFEWEVGPRYFELEVVAERAATYLYCDDAAGVEETGDVFELESLKSVLDHVYKVIATK